MHSGLFLSLNAENLPARSFARPAKVINSESPVAAIGYEPEPKVFDSWLEQFQRIVVIAQEWKQSLPLIEWVNSQHIETTSAVTAGEIKEVLDELNAGNLIKFLAEWTDALNPLAGLVSSLKLQLDLKNDVAPYVNGQGRQSNVYSLAEEISLNLSTDPEKLTRDIQEIYILMLSALRHAPPFTENLVKLAIEKMADNVRNYPQEVFSKFDDSQHTSKHDQSTLRELSPEDMNQKYTHVVKCLKWLRSLEPGRMLPLDWRLVKPFILSFRSSDESFGMLQTEWLRIHPNLLQVKKPVLVYASGDQVKSLPA